MLSELKNITRTEIFDLENYRPGDFEIFSFSLTITAGPLGGTGGDLFDIDVCTPKWLLAHQDDDIILGKGKIIVYRFDMKMILKRVSALFEGCIGKDWNEIAIKLSRIAR